MLPKLPFADREGSVSQSASSWKRRGAKQSDTQATSLSRANDNVTKERHVFRKRQLCKTERVRNKRHFRKTNFKLQSAVQDTERHFNFASYFAESAWKSLFHKQPFDTDICMSVYLRQKSHYIYCIYVCTPVSAEPRLHVVCFALIFLFWSL